MACQVIAAIKKCDHILLIEGLAAGVAKVGRDAREIEINSIAPGNRIDTIEISDPLVLDERGD
jgi:preprotein translocase subunit YajC